jgi:hypothetical protein
MNIARLASAAVVASSLLLTTLGFAQPPSASAPAAASVKPIPRATAEEATKILDKRIPDFYGPKNGVITLVGKPRLEATSNPSVVIAKGTLNNNMLWGGAYNEDYKVKVNLDTRLITPLQPLKVVKETN